MCLSFCCSRALSLFAQPPTHQPHKQQKNTPLAGTPAPTPTPTAPNAAPSTGAHRELDLHNAYRARHHAPPLAWDDALAASAQSWANNCVFQHSGPGENLAQNFGSWDAVVDAWYNEVAQYSYGNPGFSHATGHFTQMVWIGSTSLGCAVAPSCSLYVCHYAPPGNNVAAGQFEANVKAP